VAARRAVLHAAACSIESALGVDTWAAPGPEALRGVLGAERATFVTLRIEDELRGCCGTLEPARPLLLDVWHNARASAFRDPRFAPLTADEWACTDVEVSVLTPCEPMRVRGESQLLVQLVPGRDGLVLEWRGRRATFLPKVWEQVAGPREFLQRLKLKAGLPADFWRDDVAVWRYETEVITAVEPDVITAAEADVVTAVEPDAVDPVC